MIQKTHLLHVFFMVLVFVLPMYCQAQSALSASKTPLILGESLTFESVVLNESRTLNIYLPPSYDQNSDKEYPVIYLLDGSKDEDFIHIAGLVQFGAFSWIKMVPESIVVGIANVDRKRDFTFPTRREDDQKAFPTSGHSANFISFISQEVKAVVNQHYRCNDQATLIGQSLGGLLATEILLSQADLFNNFIIVSPSIWWDDQSLLEKVQSADLSDKSIFVAVGKEGDIMERDAMDLFVRLQQKRTKTTRLFFKYLEKRDHGDALHEAVYLAFEKIFEENKNNKK